MARVTARDNQRGVHRAGLESVAISEDMHVEQPLTPWRHRTVFMMQILLLGAAGLVGGGVYSLPLLGPGPVQHPRLFFSASDFIHLRQKRVASPFMKLKGCPAKDRRQ